MKLALVGRRQSWVLAVLVAIGYLAAFTSAQESTRSTLRVLFIGNSYIYFNNLGDIVAGIADVNAGGPAIAPDVVAAPKAAGPASASIGR
jgi:hypothetical protein